jgi:hypothetical protein
MTDSTPLPSDRPAAILPEGAAPHKRGGQPGNKNALKHGFYSSWYTHQEKIRLDRDMLGKLDDEEKSLNIMIDRIFAAVEKEEMTLDKTLAASRAVSLAVGRIESIHRSRKVVYDNQTTLDKAMEELKYIPFEED